MSYEASVGRKTFFERGECGQASRLIERRHMLLHLRHGKSPFRVQKSCSFARQFPVRRSASASVFSMSNLSLARHDSRWLILIGCSIFADRHFEITCFGIWEQSPGHWPALLVLGVPVAKQLSNILRVKANAAADAVGWQTTRAYCLVQGLWGR